jgi:hypothetical protein
MVANVLRYLYPNAASLRDYVITSTDGNQTITTWNPSLGPKPTIADLQTVAASPAFLTWYEEHGGDAVKTAKREARELGQSSEPLPRGVRALGLLTLDGFNGDRALISATLDLVIAIAQAIGAAPIVTSATAVKAQIPTPLTDAQGEALRKATVDSGR